MIHKLLKTNKFIPSEFHKTFFDIDFDKLYEQGIRLILTDLDNTLISYDETLPTKEIDDLFEKLTQIGFEIIIVSNNIQPRVDVFCQGLKIKGFANMRKPLIFKFKRIIKQTLRDYKKDEIIIIGDQLMTDIFAANRLKTKSILVNPLKKKTEKWYTKLNRSIEYKKLEDIKNKYPDIYKELNLKERG